MLDGRPRPLTMEEYGYWVALNNVEAKERKAAEDKAKRGSGRRPRRGRRR